MRLTYVPLGRPEIFSATFFHDSPPLREICRLPSSVPAHRTAGLLGDSAITVTVPQEPTPSFGDRISRSGVRPITGILLRSTALVRSGPSLCHVSPRSVDLNT